MSLFNKVLASVGIGAAQVDTKFANTTMIAGEDVQGIVEVKGGSVGQDIDEIYLSLVTTYIRESNDTKYNETAVISKFRITEKFSINPNELKQIPFSITIPNDTPLTIGRTKVWIETGLDIKSALDPTDKDYVKIVPLRIVEDVLNTVQSLGFRLREVECQSAPRRLRGRLPFVQEFEYVPTHGAFRGKLDELELVFIPNSKTSVDILIQVDRRVRGLGSLLAEALEMDETNLRMTITSEDIPSLSTKLSQLISRYC